MLLQALWGKAKFMRHLDKNAISRLERFFDFATVSANRDIIRQEEYGNFMVVVLSGTIAVDRLQPWGERLRLAEAAHPSVRAREAQLAAGVPRDHLYNTTMYILCAMLVIGLICNAMIRPVDPKWHMSAEAVAKLQAAGANSAAMSQPGSFGIGKGGLDVQAALFWALVGIPLAWGVWKTLQSAVRIF